MTERDSEVDDSDGVWRPSDWGVDGKPPTPLVFSSLRISFVACIPSMTGIWMSICSRLRQQGAQDASRKIATCQNEMEAARPPLGDGFLAVLRDVVFYPLLLHKRRQDRLVDRVVCTEQNRRIRTTPCEPGRAAAHGRRRKKSDAPSTMSTLIASTTL